MNITRERQQFPSRNYPYRARAAGAAGMPDALPSEPNTLYCRVLGLDNEPHPMTADELEGLADPFGRLLHSAKSFPLMVCHLLAAIDALAGGRDALLDAIRMVRACSAIMDERIRLGSTLRNLSQRPERMVMARPMAS